MSRRKPADDRKAEIVAAVLVLADRVGPDRLTTGDIAREVGVTQAAIFRHYPTKAALWVAAGQGIAHRMQSGWQQALDQASQPGQGGQPPDADPDPVLRLRGLISAQVRQVQAIPALPAILHSRELNVDNPALRDLFRGLMQQFQTHLMTALQDLIALGRLAPDLHPADAAVLLMSTMQGLAIRWSLGSRAFDLHAEGLRLLDVQLRLMARKDGTP